MFLELSMVSKVSVGPYRISDPMEPPTPSNKKQSEIVINYN